MVSFPAFSRSLHSSRVEKRSLTLFSFLSQRSLHLLVPSRRDGFTRRLCGSIGLVLRHPVRPHRVRNRPPRRREDFGLEGHVPRRVRPSCSSPSTHIRTLTPSAVSRGVSGFFICALIWFFLPNCSSFFTRLRLLSSSHHLPLPPSSASRPPPRPSPPGTCAAALLDSFSSPPLRPSHQNLSRSAVPDTAPFLTPAERELVVARLPPSANVSTNKNFSKSEIVLALKEPTTYAFLGLQMFSNLGTYGYVSPLPAAPWPIVCRHLLSFFSRFSSKQPPVVASHRHRFLRLHHATVIPIA